ncbi:MAG: PIN domain protein [Anaerolineae bacterium]
MKIQRVYVDTSVIGGCLDDEFSLWSKGLFEDFRKGNYKAVISEITEAEIQTAPEPVRNLLDELLALKSEKLLLTDEAIQLSDIYLKRQIVTHKFQSDALHIALATISESDVLVSWNFKHIVHLDKIRQFNAVNMEKGYRALQIYSPREVTKYGRD